MWMSWDSYISWHWQMRAYLLTVRALLVLLNAVQYGRVVPLVLKLLLPAADSKPLLKQRVTAIPAIAATVRTDNDHKPRNETATNAGVGTQMLVWCIQDHNQKALQSKDKLHINEKFSMTCLKRSPLSCTSNARRYASRVHLNRLKQQELTWN